MDSKRVREAVEGGKKRIKLLKDHQEITNGLKYAKESSDETLSFLIPLVDLAESVLAIAGKVPQRYSEQELEGLAGDSHLMATSRNDLIDQCTLAFAGMIPDNKQFGEEYDQNSNCDSNYVYGWNACRDAILSAMKGGGK